MTCANRDDLNRFDASASSGTRIGLVIRVYGITIRIGPWAEHPSRRY